MKFLNKKANGVKHSNAIIATNVTSKEFDNTLCLSSFLSNTNLKVDSHTDKVSIGYNRFTVVVTKSAVP